MRAFLQFDHQKQPRFRFGALLGIAGRWARARLTRLRGRGWRRWRRWRRRRWRRWSCRRWQRRERGAGSQDEQNRSYDLRAGQIWDTKHHKCLTRHSGVLPDPDLTEYAYALAKADRYQEAIDVLDLLDNPNTPRALNYRGYATRKLGRTDEGIGYYLKSVALDPNYPQVREYLGRPMSSRASTTSPSSNCRRSRSFAVRTASITRIWPTR